MPIHSETKGEDIDVQKEEIVAAPEPSEIDQEKEPLTLPSLHKAINLYRPPIPLTCHPKEVDNDKKPLKLKDLESFIVSISIGGKETTKEMLDLGASTNIMPCSVYLRLGLCKLKLTP